MPLLRPGFRPKGPYKVSFVYLHAGTPFARKGDMQMTLPKMDIPVGLVEWEVFVPENYSVRAIDGNVIDRNVVNLVSVNSRAGSESGGGIGSGSGRGVGSGSGTGGNVLISGVTGGQSGQIRGRVKDTSGGALPGVTIDVMAGGSKRTVVSGADGSFVLSGVPSGPVTLSAQLSGFTGQRQSFVFDQEARNADVTMSVGSLETIRQCRNTDVDTIGDAHG